MNMKRVFGLSAALAFALGASTVAHALKIVPSAGSDPTADTAVASITYAKETLLKGSTNVLSATDTADNTVYYKISRAHVLSAPPGVAGNAGDVYTVAYTLQGMVFSVAVTTVSSNFSVAAGGAVGDKEVVLRADADAEPSATVPIEVTANFAVSAGGGTITAAVKNQTLESALGAGKGTKTHGPVTIKVQPALKETVIPMEPAPTAKAASGFMNFGGATSSPVLHASLGTIAIGVVASPDFLKDAQDDASADIDALGDITAAIVAADDGGFPTNPSRSRVISHS